jgi:WD40 repeat protein/serine/threonine protein kinase
MSDRAQQAKSIFLEAIEQHAPAEWPAFLEQACAGDTALRAGVEKLLRAQAEIGSFHEEAADTVDPPEGACLDFLSPSTKAGSLGCLDHYEVQELVGRGGMGVVLKAVDEKLHRVVAIKVMAGPLATGAAARKRFSREAQAAAAVRNDHVVGIHAVEEAGGLPYLVMEYVCGVSLQERLDQGGPLQLREILRIGMQTAAGLAAAHAQGLVHRDVKPANILLENGVERVKLTDFGLARAVDDASLTQSGVVAGTPQYMAPEQAKGEAVDHRADLFSLGSVLYAMCTGHPPFRAASSMAVLKRVCEEAPRPIPEINPEVPGWLVGIIARLHAKDPAQRFQSAAEVAELLNSHLADLQQPPPPATGDPPPTIKLRRPRGRRWLLAAALLAVLAGGLGLSEATGVTRLSGTVLRVLSGEGTLVVEVDDPEVKVTIEGDGGLVLTGAGPQEVRLRPGSYRLAAAREGRPARQEIVTISRGDRRVVRVSLEPAGPAQVQGPFRFVPPPVGPLDLLDPAKIPFAERFDWQPKELVAVLGEHRGQQGAWTTGVTLSPDGKRAATCGFSLGIHIWDADTLHLRSQLFGHKGGIWGVAFSPDGHRLLSGGEDHILRVWDIDIRKEPRCFRGHTGTIWSVAYSADGRRALSGGQDHTLRLWDVDSGTELHCFQGHTDRVSSVAFSPDGVHAVSGSADKTLRLWNLETRKEVRHWEAHRLPFRLVFLPDGRRALSGSEDRTVRLWDVHTGRQLRCFGEHADFVYYVAVSRDGRWAISGDRQGVLRLWDVETGQELRRMQCRGGCGGLAFSPDGRRALSVAGPGNLQLWELPGGKEINPAVGFRDESHRVLRIAFSPDGRRVLVSARDNLMRLWDVASGRELHRLELPQTIWGVAFSADGRQLLGAGGNHMALWDAQSGQEVRRFAGARGIWDAALSGDGHRVVTGGTDGAVRLWDVESGRELNYLRGHSGEVYGVALAPDGRAAVSGGLDGTARLWDLETGHERHLPQAGGDRVWSVAFSPDGGHVAAGDRDGFVRLWDVSGKAPRRRPLLKWHADAVRSLAFAPDGQMLASADWGRIILWDVASGAKRHEWQFPEPVEGVAFAADGRHLATANGNGTVYILRLPRP